MLLNWVPVRKGHLALGHRPKVKDLKILDASMVVTLLSEKEGALEVGAVVDARADFLWFPLDSAKPPKQERSMEAWEIFSDIEMCLDHGGRVFIHCSAGLHRTGMIAYGLLRYLGYGHDASMTLIRDMREVTAMALTEERTNWGKQYSR